MDQSDSKPRDREEMNSLEGSRVSAGSETAPKITVQRVVEKVAGEGRERETLD